VDHVHHDPDAGLDRRQLTMVRSGKTAAPAAPRQGRQRAVNVDSVRAAAEAFMARVESVAAEVGTLREALASAQQENQGLRSELAEAVVLFQRAEAALGGTSIQPTRRRVHRQAVAAVPSEVTKAKRPTRPVRIRVTPTTVTAEVVRGVIEALGSATAAEIADEISTRGTSVSGRAIRHIAKTAGAVVRAGADGRMVYSLA
jgi:hypothetical protein